MTKKLPPNPLPACPICGKPANKTNTHLVPWFLIKDTVTEKGAGLRDKQMTFTIGAGQPVRLHTGRGVLPEALEQLPEEHQVEAEEHDEFTRDYLWCASCEEKFSHLESLFSDVFPDKRLMDQPDDLHPYHGQRILIDEKLDVTLYQLFVHSIFWRCSMGRFDGFALDPAVEKKLLMNLQAAFGEPGFLKTTRKDVVPVVHTFPLITSYLCPDEQADVTAYVVSTNKVRRPYMIVAAKWVFQLFEKERHVVSSIEYLYGLREALDPVGLYLKIHDGSHVVLVNTKVSNKFLMGLLETVTKAKIREEKEGARRVTRALYVQVFKVPPKRVHEDFVVGRYLKHRGEGKQELESCELAVRELASELGVPFIED